MDSSTPSHHLVLGKTTDVLTGETLDDTHDERLRQDLARLLLKKGFARADILPRLAIPLENRGQKARAVVDLTVRISGKSLMILRYGPGSLVTRHRPALAASRLLETYPVPVVVVTNGRDAEVLDGATGKVTGRGLDNVPDRDALGQLSAAWDFSPVPEKRRILEERVLFTHDFVGACNCDECEI